MIAYYTENNGFLYTIISSKDAKNIKMIDEDCIPEFDTTKEIHLTTDNSWNLYLEKRQKEPSMVKIYKTQSSLNKDLEILGFYI